MEEEDGAYNKISGKRVLGTYTYIDEKTCYIIVNSQKPCIPQ